MPADDPASLRILQRHNIVSLMFIGFIAHRFTLAA
jgi:hypothetical protein